MAAKAQGVGENQVHLRVDRLVGHIVQVTSPMVGVFYAAPAENAEPFVKVGDRVKRGQTLCIVEAMKLMNEIMAELDGEIVEVCVQNGQVVDFGCPLFRIKGQ